MKLKQLVVLIFLTSGAYSFSQMTYEYDTLRYGDQVLGITDSIDFNTGDLPTTFDGGRSILSEDGLSLNRLVSDYTGFRFNSFGEWKKMQFSALPYIGFSYSFGSNATQSISTQYTQAFSDSLLLNIHYSRNSGAGFIRNTAFTRNDLSMQLEWKAKFYSMQLRGAYLSDSSGHAGGLDSLDVSLGLELESVRKTNAASKTKQGIVELNNYINFNPGNLARIGLITKHRYEISDRHYHELDTLYGIYGAINIDSLTTFDKFTHASIRNGAGLFFSRKGAYVDGRLAYTYWRVGNLGNQYDTTEIDLNSSIRWTRNRFNFTNKLHFNILGGYNALSNRFGVSYKVSKLSATGMVVFDNSPPVVMKRSYFSNNFNYSQTDIRLQQLLRIKGGLGYEIKGDTNAIFAAVEYAQMNNTYLFNDSTWERSSQVISAIRIAASAKFQFGKFHLQPRLIYTIQAENYLPDFQGYLRLYLKSTVFKAKKLLLVLGVDASYTSSFDHKMFTPAMDAYTWYQPLGTTKPMANLHTFTAIEISTFRFFLRFENIGAFWNDPLSQELNAYPLSGSRLRVGITWDFFN
ncbi:MAG: hypothetical protein ACI865_001573 [Flavobacteriaceae bacterium]|jgi:hypothetical protein